MAWYSGRVGSDANRRWVRENEGTGHAFRWLNRMQTKRPSTLLILDAVEEQEWEGAVVLELRHAEQRRKKHTSIITFIAVPEIG
ncbi:hypothetical protein M378DRAFT_157513, partial [Amanita muscaria Koide BX008]